MTRIAPRATSFALAAALTLAMLAATNALANHQYRLAASAGEHAAPVAEQVERVTVAEPLDTVA